MIRQLFLLLLLGIAPWVRQPLIGQSTQLAEARGLFAAERYEEALAVLHKQRKLIRDNREARLLAALCHYQLNSLDASADLLYQSAAEKNADAQVYFYLGRIAHHQHQFDKAAQYYKQYLLLLRDDHPQRQWVRDLISCCSNGIKLQYSDGLAVTENLGERVNTDGDEFNPIPSPTLQNRVYLSAAREGSIGGRRNHLGQTDNVSGTYHADIVHAKVTDDGWGKAQPLTYLINSPQHEILLGFRADGSAMYYFQGKSMEYGRILIDTFRAEGERSLHTNPWSGPINPLIGDRTVQIIDDTLIYFSSKRAGGLGGYDLYRAVKHNNHWQPAENLGTPVNTPYDETTPFLARDGRTLFFSSNDPRRSIGGLDVFKSVYQAAQRRWSTPYHMRLPINSAGNDAHFRIAADGFMGYLDSDRKDGYGKRDVYAVYFNEVQHEMEQIATLYEVPSTLPPSDSPPPADTPSPPSPAPVIAEPTPTPPAPSQPTPRVTPAPPPTTASTSPWVSQQVQRPRQSSFTVYLPAATPEMAAIGQHITAHNSLQLVLTAYGPGTSAKDAVSTNIALADYLRQQLIQAGVPGQRIFLRSFRDDGPARVEVSYTGTLETPLYQQVPVIGNHYPAPVRTSPLNTPLLYKVQLSSVRRPDIPAKLAAQSQLMVETGAGSSYYRYTSGAFTTFREADRYRQQMIRSGYKDAFVVVYGYGRRINRSEAKRLLGVFDDLANYLQ